MVKYDQLFLFKYVTYFTNPSKDWRATGANDKECVTEFYNVYVDNLSTIAGVRAVSPNS